MKTFHVSLQLTFMQTAESQSEVLQAVHSFIKDLVIYRKDPEDGRYKGMNFEPLRSGIEIRLQTQAERDVDSPLPF